MIAPASERAAYPLRPLRGAESEFTEAQSITAPQLQRTLGGAGVGQALLYASRFHGFDNSYCVMSAQLYPERFAAVANVDVRSITVVSDVEYWTSQRGMHGVRLWAGGRGSAMWLGDEALDSLWRKLAGEGIPFNGQTTDASALPAARRLLERFGEARLVINNLAHLDKPGALDWDSFDVLRKLAVFPHVYVNFSSAFAARSHDRSSHEHRMLVQLLESFGAHRLMWSAFYPSWQAVPYWQSVGDVRAAVSFLSASEQADVLGGSARTLYPSLVANSPERTEHV